MRYHIWTIGCQMNEADSGRVAAELDALGYEPSDDPGLSDVIVLNTCVVRQSAEDRALGRLYSLKPLKDERPDRVIALMGCLVGIRPDENLKARFPFVDVFMPPSEPGPLVGFLKSTEHGRLARFDEQRETSARHWLQDEASPEAAAIGLIDEKTDPFSPAEAWPSDEPQPGVVQSIRHRSLHQAAPVTAHVPVVYGCSHACTFCIIPYRRGVERSRPLAEVVREIEGLVRQGVREVTLLGQIVDCYGRDLGEAGPDLADLLGAVDNVDGLWRIRFLTSHPNYMSDRLLAAVATLPKVCRQIEIPVQAGDNEILEQMRRGYTVEAYRELVHHVRDVLPGAAIHTDIIVGFPGESERQFHRTYDLLEELRLDKAHLAMYSSRPGTVSARRMADDVPESEKKRRWEALDRLQARVVGEINSRLLGKQVEVLVDGAARGRWRGRTRTNKLVFFSDDRDWLGRRADVHITWTGPWSLIGTAQPAD
jgi:tRNA-2-methylthio-N6-dimethylallyladenosine synthase